jgi:aerobic carbon-monoxide dehydrogenase medium subunit
VKLRSFRLHRPEAVGDAVDLVARFGDDAKVIAGGQSLLPLLALRLTYFNDLVDINLVDSLSGVDLDENELVIGAMTRQADAESSAQVERSLPLISRALKHVGHFQIRNRGTVGGSLAHADPSSELPAVALALEASMEIVGPKGLRRVPADGFFVDRWTTTLGPDEILTSVRLPVGGGRRGFAIREVARRNGDFAMAGAVCAVTVADGRVDRAAVSLFGVDRTPLLRPQVAAELTGRPVHDLTRPDFDELGVLAAADLDPPDDVHATGTYRRAVSALLIGDALQSAVEEAASA